MTANAEDTSHLVAMARSGLATHMLRILPDGETASGLSGGAEEGALLDLLADHLDTPVFRLGHGRYAMEADAETVDALMRAVPQCWPGTEFAVQAFVPPGEKASDTQTRVISRIECATEAIQAVLSRLDRPEGAAPEVPAVVTGEGLLDALTERDAALLEAVDSRLNVDWPATVHGALPGMIVEAVRQGLAEVPPPRPEAGEMAEIRSAIGVLDARVAALGERSPGPELERMLDSRLASMEQALHAHLEARLDSVDDIKSCVADAVQAAAGRITGRLQEIDSKLAREHDDSGAGLAGARSPASAQAETALADRLDALQHQITGIATGGVRLDPTAITDAFAVQMANLETTLAAAIVNVRPEPETLQPLAESLPEQIAAALAEPLADIDRKLAHLGSRTDPTADAIGAVLDPRLDAQSARILTSVAAHLAQQPLLEELQATLGRLDGRLDGIEPLLQSAPESRQKIADGVTEALAAQTESLMKAATDSLAGHLVGAEDLLQARLEAQHSQLSAGLLRHLSDLGDRIESLVGRSPGNNTLVETISAAQAAETARIAEAVDRLGETMASLPEIARASEAAEPPDIVTRIDALESMLEAGVASLTTIKEFLRPDSEASPLEIILARLTDLTEEFRAQRGASARRVEDAEHTLLGRIDEMDQSLSRRLDEDRLMAAAPMPTDDTGALGQSVNSSVAMESMLRRLDTQIARFEAAEVPDFTRADGIDSVMEPPRATLRSEIARLGSAEGDLAPILEDIRDRLSRLTARGAEGIAMAPLSVAMQTMLRRLDAQISRFEAVPAPMADSQNLDSLTDAVAQLERRFAHDLGTLGEELRRPLSEVSVDLTREPQHPPRDDYGLHALSVAMQSMLQRLDEQIVRLEAAAPTLPAPTDPGNVVAQLRESEAQLIARIEQIAPGQIDDGALRSLSARLQRTLDCAAPDTEGMAGLSSALQSTLWRLDRQVSELEARGDGGGEIVQDVNMVLAEYIAQIDKSLATTEQRRRGA